ncbi:MAG: geranylgeranyl reductase family protein [Candidatus Bathyarchaeia archaeon]
MGPQGRANPLYDLVVVGAGPAGSMTARAAAEEGLDVLLLDRELEIGVPDKCGEFLPSLEEMRRLAPDAERLEAIFDPPSGCIVNRTRYVRFVFPNGKEIIVPFNGVVVERKLYDKHLANEAARAGAEIAPMTRALDLLKDGRGVRARDIEGGRDIPARTVAGADGANSLIARRAGLPVSDDPLDYAVGYQYEMVDVEHDPEYVDMYFGRDIAPGTYAWIIPKGDDIANVGTGARAPYMERGRSIRDYLKNLIEKHPAASEKLRKAATTAIKAGCIPVGGPMVRTCVGDILVVGDAAGHTIPTVGGGVPPALICGEIAGRAIAEHVKEGKPLALYEGAWRGQLGATLGNALRLRRMSDVIFKSERTIDFITKRGWLTEEMLEKLILCRVDARMRIVERTLLQLMKKL